MPHGVSRSLAEPRKSHGVFFLCMWYLSYTLGFDLAARWDWKRGDVRPQHHQVQVQELPTLTDIFLLNQPFTTFVILLSFYFLLLRVWNLSLWSQLSSLHIQISDSHSCWIGDWLGMCVCVCVELIPKKRFSLISMRTFMRVVRSDRSNQIKSYLYQIWWPTWILT